MKSISAFPTSPKAVPTNVIKNIVLTQASTRITAPDNASSKTENTYIFQPQYQEGDPHRSPEFNQQVENDTN